MGSETHAPEPPILIRTKLQHPRLSEDLVPRPRLLDRLHAGSDRKLTLISAMAGAGKTTLLAQWLEERPQPSAWLSLDERDNDRIVFLSYLCGAIRTVFPSACENALSLLKAPHTAPASVFIASIINELDELVATPSQSLAPPPQAGGPSAKGMILALDDYHHITEPAIHEILSGLIEHLPRGIHVALATRTDPQLPLAGWRAHREMTEVRSVDLRFTSEETYAFLEETTGRELNPETIRLLESKTEGWVVGLRLAALSIRTRPDDEAFVGGFKGTGGDLIVGYLVSEVLARQPPALRDCMLRLSILDRFCTELCDAVLDEGRTTNDEGASPVVRPASQGAVKLAELNAANVFLVPLGGERRWYRYHHLLQDLLRHELRQQYSEAAISGLHARAGAWFAQNGLIDEALHHLVTANDISAAADLVARHRYTLMNGARWQRLDRYLHLFSPDILDQYPDLLMLRTWLLYHRGQWAELPAALQRLEAAISRASLPPEEVNHLQGEISALRSLLSYHAVNPKGALASAQQALEETARELWIVRILARLYLAGVLHMRGDSSRAYAALYRGFEEEETQSHAFKATLVMTACHLHWLGADLGGMAQAANQCITLCQQSDSPQILNYGHYHLGRVCYQQNDLTAAERNFTIVVQQPYLNYGDCFANSACGLALVHQVQGRPDTAQAVIESALAFLLETGNTSLMPLIQSFQAEIALRQGHIAQAGLWAAQLDPIPPLTPIYGFFSPHLTLVKIWLAQDTPDSRRQAADLLDTSREFVEATHNTRFLIEVLALQALLQDGQGERGAALELLEQAVALAEPGGFIRLFVDLGPPLERLLDRLRWQGVAPDYIGQILAASGTQDEGRRTDAGPSSFVASTLARRPASGLIEPLTPRELEVLAMLDRHLTNQEIAEALVVSPSTVKTHTLNIYRKLEVHGRKQAVARAIELDILPPNVM